MSDLIERLPGPPILLLVNPQRRRWPLIAGLMLLVIAIIELALFVASPRRSHEPDQRPQSVRVVDKATPLPAPPPPPGEQKILDLAPETARVVNAERPIINQPLAAPIPYLFTGVAEDRRRAIACLAAASWYEAGDDAPGQRAVMQVVLNRVRHPAFARTVCGVVFQGSERPTGCQFSFTCDGSIVRRRPSPIAWARAQKLAAAALGGATDRDVGLATHYHANYVVPYWAADGDKLAQLGLHIFYRWHGFWGTRAAFDRTPGREEPRFAALAGLSPDHVGGLVIPTLVSQAVEPVTAAAAIAATAALPPPVQVEGVREKSMRGALVRSDRGNQYFIQLDAATFPGNYATAAVALCKGKPVCSVFGWTDAASMGLAMPLGVAQRKALAFYFNQSSDGADEARWNCAKISRANKSQCLDDAVIAALPPR